MSITRPFELVVVPCRADNYAFLLHNSETGETALCDAPEAELIAAVLAARGWVLSDILLTHHHYDHVDGVAALRAGARVIGAAADAHRLPALDLAVAPGDVISVCGQDTAIFDVSGHTVGHIAFHMGGAGYAFTGDSLMALGCGRLFEGTPAMMWQSMQRMRDLPDETLICSGHEYTAANGRFALSLDPENTDLILRMEEIEALRGAGQPTVPSTLQLEKRTNPFLRADVAAFKSVLGMADAKDDEVFTHVRALKDKF